MNDIRAEIKEALVNGYYLKDEKSPAWADGSMKVITPKPEAIDKLVALLEKKIREAQSNLIDIAIERLKNDEYYTLQAWIEDVSEYLNRTEQLKDSKATKQ